MSLRTAALVLALLLAAPAALVLLRAPRGGERAAPARWLDALWAVVPVALLAALIALSAAA